MFTFRKLLKDSGLKQRDYIRITGRGQSLVSRWMNNRVKTPIEANLLMKAWPWLSKDQRVELIKTAVKIREERENDNA